MAKPSLGSAYIQIVPSADGIKGSITKILEGEVDSAVNAASQAIETGLSDATSSAAVSISSELDAAFEGLDDAASSVSDTVTDVGDEIGDAGEKASESVKGVGEEVDKASGKASTFGEMLKANLASDAIINGVKKLGQAVVDFEKAAVSGYADYEHLIGGVETLFKEDAGTVQKYAENAYKTAGLSANQYMETVTSFSASLLQSLGGDTKAAAEMADLAITDMADNANKMGTDMQSIQNAYQGFAKQNYTMLDNLKLGYGGTKSEMERLLEDAEKISGIEYNIDSYADIVEAIHVVQDEMGITGTTSKEAATTIEGSVNSAKAAWDNWVADMANENADVAESTEALALSMATALDNIVPKVEQTVVNVAKAIANIPEALSEVHYQDFLDDDTFDSYENVAAKILAARDSVTEWNEKVQEAVKYGNNATYQSQQYIEAMQNLEKLLNDIGTKQAVYEGIASGELSAAEAAELLETSVEDIQRGLESYRQQTQAAAEQTDNLSDALSEEEQAAKETHDAIIDIASAAIDARYSGDDLRESYNELSSELDKLRDEGDDTAIMLAEQKLATLNLAATNQELITGLDQIPGAMNYARGSTVQMAQALIDAGLTADDYVASVESMRDGTINSFKLLADESAISAEEMGQALASNKETVTQWGSDLEALWAEAYANQDTAVLSYISYLSDLGPDYAAAVHDFASGGYDELASQAKDFADVGELSAKYTAEGIAAKSYLAGDSMTELADAAVEVVEDTDFSTPGSNIVEELAEGVDGNAYVLSNAASSAVSSAYNAADGATSDFYDVGYHIDTGMASGVRGGTGIVVSAVNALADKIISAAKSKLKEASPSRVFRDDIGANIPAGLALGIQDGVGAVEESVKDLAAATINAYNPGGMDLGTYYMDAQPGDSDAAYTGSGRGGTVINNYFTVNGAENPEDYANRLARQLNLQMRMA